MLGYFLVASLAASFGFLLGGVMASGKVSSLASRLQEAELKISEQSSMLEELSRALRCFSDGAGDGPADQAGGKAVKDALEVLERK